MIGGIDIRIDGRSCPNPVWFAAFTIFKRWPDATFEDGATGCTYQDLAKVFSAKPSELFVYRDAEAARIWDEEGAVEGVLNAMIHLLADRDDLVVVVDEENSDMALIIDAIKVAMISGEPVPDEEIFVGQKTLAQAQSFRLATNILYGSNQVNSVVAPCYVNGTLALEFFLKALQSSETHLPVSETLASFIRTEPDTLGPIWEKALKAESSRKGHKLTELFDHVDQKTRDWMSVKFVQLYSSRMGRQLRDQMVNYDNSFVNVRYINEGKSDFPAGDFADLLRFVNFVGDRVEEIYGNSQIGKARNAIRDLQQKN